MAYGLPTKAKIKPDTCLTTYFLARRLESSGILRPGQALMLAAALPNNQAKPKRGKRK